MKSEIEIFTPLKNDSERGDRERNREEEEQEEGKETHRCKTHTHTERKPTGIKIAQALSQTAAGMLARLQLWWCLGETLSWVSVERVERP